MATARFGHLTLDDAVRLNLGELPTFLQWTACPEPDCHATAEVIDRYMLGSTDGPVSMVRARCLGQHIRHWVDDQAPRK